MERLNLDKFKILAAAATLAMFAGTACAEVELFAQANRALSHTDDGFQQSTLFVDNAFSPSTLGVKSMAHLNKCVSFGGIAEVQLNANNSRMVNQVNNNETDSDFVQVRRLDTYISAGMWGKLSLGYGDAASYGITRMSYARTGDTVSASTVGDLAGGMLFHPSASTVATTYANPSVNMTFNPIDGVGSFDSLTGRYDQKARIRWDSDKWNGLGLAVSFGNVQEVDLFVSGVNAITTTTRSYVDVALRYEGNFDDFMLSAGIAYAEFSKDGIITNANGTTAPTTTAALARSNRLWAGSIAAEHKCTGINLAFSYGNKRQIVPASNNQKAWFIQLGKHFDFTHYGKTNIALDYFQGKNALVNNDKSKSYAIGVTQDMDKVNSSVYATVRSYKYTNGVNRAGTVTAFNSMWVGSVGFLVKFGAML